MRKILTTLFFCSLPFIAFAQLQAVSGGTGTTTKPTLGQILVGQSNGTYGPQATSTLGISGSALTPNGTNRSLGSNTNPWQNLFIGGLPTGNWKISTSSLNANTLLVSDSGYPSVFFGADDASPVSNIELNDLNQGPYASYGIKLNNGGGTFTAALVLDTNDTIAGIPQYLSLVNQTGSATCLQIRDNGATCLSDYNGLSSLLDTISPAYNAGGTESGMTTTLLQANGNDAIDYGLQNYPGTFATGIDAYQNYYSNLYPQPLPEPHFSFWEQANGNTSEASTSWGFLGATTTVSGPNATTTSVDIGDLGNTPMFHTLLNPNNATFNVVSSSSKSLAFTVAKNTNGVLTNDFTVSNTGVATATNLVDSALATPAGAILAVNPLGQVIATTTPSGGSGVTSVATDATLTGGPITTTGTLGLNLSNANTWTALQTFSNASSTLISSTYASSTAAYITATSTTATSTFAGQVDSLGGITNESQKNCSTLGTDKNGTEKCITALATTTGSYRNAAATISSVNTLTPTASSTYQISVSASVKTISAGTLTITCTYTSTDGIASTVTFFPMGLTSAGLTGTGVAAFSPAVITPMKNTAVTIVATFTGVSINYDVDGSILPIGSTTN